MTMRAAILFLLLNYALAFSVLPAKVSHGVSQAHNTGALGKGRAVVALRAKKKNEPIIPMEKLGPLPYLVPALFVGQICFLVVAKLVCGLDNLEEYGRLGNEYIRGNNGYDRSKSLLERQAITSAGQSIWFKNVFRDIQNGGPVKPPISEP